MSLPRVLSLVDAESSEDSGPDALRPDDRRLKMVPVSAVESLREDHVTAGRVDLPHNERVFVDGIEGATLELFLQINPKDSSVVEIDVLRSPDGEERTRIGFYADRGYRIDRYDRRSPARYSILSVDTSHSSALPGVRTRPPENAPVLLDPDGRIRLRIFVDRSVVEVFAGDSQCVGVRVYPGRRDSTGVALKSIGGSAIVERFDAWSMASVYPER